MPDRRSIFRLLALAGFLLTVALALWLAELRPLVVVVVMAIALLVAWTVEWLSWRQDVARLAVEAVDVRDGEVALPLMPPPLAAPDPEPAPAEPEAAPEVVAEHPPEPAEEPEVAPLEPAAEPEPEPESQPEPGPAPPQPALRPVPAPPVPPAQPARPPQPARPAVVSRDVIDLRTRVTAQPRRWNLWDLERRARDEAQRDPLRYEEWSFLFVHLRQFASPDGSLPTEFDGLVRESFGELLEHAS